MLRHCIIVNLNILEQCSVRLHSGSEVQIESGQSNWQQSESIQLIWLTSLKVALSHSPKQPCNKNDIH